ncbi:protein of unknown function [Salegentibacter echinorum]|uniref:DUF4252 domain-containing protein n=1 Tax=Salegentibacter echinorum TaxID=1073325 RepID=A0A1M5D2A0_SALEC|nr:DUF4252 domain-containing protein [Salegentibacter echinorum]SHF61044.1 protein of unknown function [Salegentibacter echinorum]
MKTIKTSLVFFFAIILVSCSNEQSLQEYNVENQQNNNFMALDIPTSMFANAENLSVEQKETLQSVKKVNLLGLSIENGREDYETEKENLENILKHEKYQLLMKYGSNSRKAEIFFTGDEEAIDELIVYGYDDTKGVGVARVLGKNMNPTALLDLMKSLDKGDINIDGLKKVTGIFKDEME